MTTTNICFALAGIIYISPQILLIPLSSWALLGFALTCMISVFLNTDTIAEPMEQIRKLGYFPVAILAISPLALWLESMALKHKKMLIAAFLFSVTLASIVGAISLYTGFNPLKWKAACHDVRSCGMYSQYMTYGYGLSMALVLMIGARVYYKEWQDYLPRIWLLDAVIALNLVGLFLSYTRGAWLGLLLGAPLVLFPKSPKKFIIATLTAITALSLTLACSAGFRQKLLDREQSNSERLSFFKAAVYAAKEKPFFGWGYKNFEPNMISIKEKYDLPHKERGGHGHSNYFEHLGSTGIVGLTFLFLFLLLWLIESYSTNPIVFGFAGSFAISGLFQYTLGDGENTLLLMTIYALFCAQKQSE